MQLPVELRQAIEEKVEGASTTLLSRARAELSEFYRDQRGSLPLFGEEGARLAYLGARMPATYAAICKVFEKGRELLEGVPLRRMLDLGAGPGTGGWAALASFPELEKVYSFEGHPDILRLGQELAQKAPLLQKSEWRLQSLTAPFSWPEADFALLSYVLGELSHPEQLLQGWWDSSVPYLFLLEPGTPRGFSLILKLREKALSLGAHLIAPCPHVFQCPMKGGDWCHFSARVERSRLHRLLKGGSLGFEDEKFCYLILSKKELAMRGRSRIVKPPHHTPGFLSLPLCTERGELEDKKILKREKELYKRGRKLEWGDLL